MNTRPLDEYLYKPGKSRATTLPECIWTHQQKSLKSPTTAENGLQHLISFGDPLGISWSPFFVQTRIDLSLIDTGVLAAIAGNSCESLIPGNVCVQVRTLTEHSPSTCSNTSFTFQIPLSMLRSMLGSRKEFSVCLLKFSSNAKLAGLRAEKTR